MKSSNKSKSPQGQFSQHFDFIKNICKFYYQNINFFQQKMKILMNISLKMRTSRIPKAILSLLPLPTSTEKNFNWFSLPLTRHSTFPLTLSSFRAQSKQTVSGDGENKKKIIKKVPNKLLQIFVLIPMKWEIKRERDKNDNVVMISNYIIIEANDDEDDDSDIVEEKERMGGGHMRRSKYTLYALFSFLG